MESILEASPEVALDFLNFKTPGVSSSVLQKQVSRFYPSGNSFGPSGVKQLKIVLQGEGWKGFEKARELTDWHGDEWNGTPRETGPGSPRKASRVRRDSMKRTSSFAPTQRQKRFSTAKLLEQQKAKEAAAVAAPEEVSVLGTGYGKKREEGN